MNTAKNYSFVIRNDHKSFIRQESPGISDELWKKLYAVEDRILQVRNLYDIKIEIVTLVVKGIAKFAITLDLRGQIQVGSRSVAFRRVFDLKLKGIHLTKTFSKSQSLIGNSQIQYFIEQRRVKNTRVHNVYGPA